MLYRTYRIPVHDTFLLSELNRWAGAYRLVYNKGLSLYGFESKYHWSTRIPASIILEAIECRASLKGKFRPMTKKHNCVTFQYITTKVGFASDSSESFHPRQSIGFDVMGTPVWLPLKKKFLKGVEMPFKFLKSMCFRCDHGDWFVHISSPQLRPKRVLYEPSPVFKLKLGNRGKDYIKLKKLKIRGNGVRRRMRRIMRQITEIRSQSVVKWVAETVGDGLVTPPDAESLIEFNPIFKKQRLAEEVKKRLKDRVEVLQSFLQ